MTLLRELGERRIIEDILPSVCPSVGDDCAYIGLEKADLVVTTDPVPTPAAKVIGGDPDLYWAGRLLVTINASDLAAAGAAPLGFLAAVECPSDWSVSDLERLFAGIADGCSCEGLSYSGGNLKEAAVFAATGTAIGWVPRGSGLRRRGAQPRDRIFSVGQGGEFWRDVFAIRQGIEVSKSESKVFAPVSQVRQMGILREGVRIAASMDNSDGLLASLEQLARLNSHAIALDLDSLSVPNTNASALDQAKWWMGWGDWNVLIAVPDDEHGRLCALASRHGIGLIEIGAVLSEPPGVFLKRDNTFRKAPRLESERFAADSWFSEGIEGYISRLSGLDLSTP